MSKLMLSYLFKTNLSTFRSAILNDDTDKICRILDIERDYLHKYIDTEGNTPLLLAVEHASSLTVRLLLEQGAQPDQPNRINFRTPLGFLASKVYEDYDSHEAQRSLEMAKILLKYNAYIDKPCLRTYKDENNQDYFGKETPLMTAVRKKNLPLVKFLIENKADVNYAERKSQIRAIHFAITNGDETIFDILVNANHLSCSSISYGDNTLLHWFCDIKENDLQISLLNKLIEKGTPIDMQNSEKNTPLMLAAKNDMINTCRILLENGANINQYDSNGHKPIDLSISGSECSKLFHQQLKLNECKSPGGDNSVNRRNEAIVWRRKVYATRRFTTEISNINSNETNSRHTSTKDSIDEEEQINLTHSPNISSAPRRVSEEINTKYARLREKLLQTGHKRRILKLNKQRAYTIDIGDESP